MPKQSKADDPTFRLISRIPRPIGSSPLPHDLPAEAWARLFAAALLRLQRAKPRWASATAVQVDNLLASWLVFNRDPSLSRPELDLRLEEVLEHLEAHPQSESSRAHPCVAARSPAPERLPQVESNGLAGQTPLPWHLIHAPEKLEKDVE